MAEPRQLWVWYVASGDEHGRYWAIATRGSWEPQFVVDSVELRVPSRTHRDDARARGVLEVSGRLHVRRDGDRLVATVEDDSEAPSPPAPIDEIDAQAEVQACAERNRFRRAAWLPDRLPDLHSLVTR